MVNTVNSVCIVLILIVIIWIFFSAFSEQWISRNQNRLIYFSFFLFVLAIASMVFTFPHDRIDHLQEKVENSVDLYHILSLQSREHHNRDIKLGKELKDLNWRIRKLDKILKPYLDAEEDELINQQTSDRKPPSSGVF